VGGAALIILGAIWLVTARRGHDANPVEAAPEVSAPRASPAAPPPAVLTEPELPAVAAPTIVDPASVQPQTKAPRTRKQLPPIDSAKSTAPPAPPVVAEPAPVAVAPPPRVVEPARVDPLQSLNEGLSRCAREDMLNRPGCEQRVRSQHCGGLWGQVLQCPIGPSEHGS
jgi:hypothetical protein